MIKSHIGINRTVRSKVSRFLRITKSRQKFNFAIIKWNNDNTQYIDNVTSWIKFDSKRKFFLRLDE